MKQNKCLSLIAASLISLTACAKEPQTRVVCPVPIYPDDCAIGWYEKTETPACFDKWIDKIDRQQSVLKKAQETNR